MIEKLRRILNDIEEAIYYEEEYDQAWSPEYTYLCKQRKILKNAIKKLERLEDNWR